MVTFLISALAILVIIGIGLYFWQKPRRHESESILPPPPPDGRGLFADFAAAEETAAPLVTVEERTAQAMARAQGGERSALGDANEIGDRKLYDRVLSELVNQADSDAKLLALMSYISQHNLPADESLSRAVMNSWLKSPGRHTTSKALHFAALSDNAEIYREAVERALGLWRAGKLPDVSPAELTTLFDGEFWILPSGTRSSGAGFVLKQTLADARRELEATASANP